MIYATLLSILACAATVSAQTNGAHLTSICVREALLAWRCSCALPDSISSEILSMQIQCY